MSEADTAAPAPDAAAGTPLRFLGQYIKDLSFEVPHTPEIFAELRAKGPEIPISIDCDVRDTGPNQYEVTSTVHAKATLGSKTVFILELVYGASVELNPAIVAQEHIHPLLLIEVPRLMFPFIRQVLADATVGGGFPPLMLQMVDFSELYRRKFAAAAGQPAEGVPAEPTVN